MKKVKTATIILNIGCFILGASSVAIWGIKGLFFAIGLVMIINPYIYKLAMEE